MRGSSCTFTDFVTCSTAASQGVNSPRRFVAGSFVNQAVPNSPESTSEEYKNEAIRHIAPVQTGSTALISVTSSLLRALHIAVKNPNTSLIAVIDLHQIDNVHWVPSLNLKTYHQYHGRSEYLIWGSIEEQAIISTVTFSSFLARLSNTPGHLRLFRFDIIQKFKAMRSVCLHISRHRRLRTYSTGVATGVFANALALEAVHLSSLVEHIKTQWNFKRSSSKDDQAFMDGVQEGFHRSFEETEPSTFEQFLESLETFLSGADHSDTLTLAVGAIDPPNHAVEGVEAENHDSVVQDVSVTQRRADTPKLKLEDDTVMKKSIVDEPCDMDWCNIKSEHDDEIPHPDVPASIVPRIGQWKEIGGYGPWTLRLYDTGMPAGDRRIS